MSAEIGRRGSMTRHQQAVLAGAVSDRLTLHEAARAAFDGDFNPADLFGSLLSRHDTPELARLLGRHGRGHDVCLEPDMAKELRRQFSVWTGFDAAVLQPGELPSGEQATAQLITQAACELFPGANWMDVLDRAIEAGGAITLTGRSAKAAA